MEKLVLTSTVTLEFTDKTTIADVCYFKTAIQQALQTTIFAESMNKNCDSISIEHGLKFTRKEFQNDESTNHD